MFLERYDRWVIMSSILCLLALLSVVILAYRLKTTNEEGDSDEKVSKEKSKKDEKEKSEKKSKEEKNESKIWPEKYGDKNESKVAADE